MTATLPQEFDQDASSLIGQLRRSFGSDHTRPVDWRKAQLMRLLDLVRENEAKILDALRRDIGRPPFEGWLAEVNTLKGEIRHTLAALEAWVKPRAVPIPLGLRPGKAYVIPEPLGVVLIISPWNYPIQLCLGPLVPALAAGNCAVLKPSELSPASSGLIADLVPLYLDSSALAVVQGGICETTALLHQRWDHILFTGSQGVARIVMTEAARHLTPVTLELGGKSPVIVDHTADLEAGARRIIWSKSINAGQTCIAPDYVLVEAAVKQRLIDAMIKTLKSFFGDDPQLSSDYGRIISQDHFDRITALMRNGRIVHGGQNDRDSRFIEVTLLDEISPTAPIMEEEIFGPLLPIVTVKDISEAVEFVNARPKPLALYLFSSNKDVQQTALTRTSSGGAVINDCAVQFGVRELPFGGVGASGMGAYHGRNGFDTFSHLKSVLVRGTSIDPTLRYPPYTKSKKKWVNWLGSGLIA